MEYFVIDVGGSSVKYAVMDENMKFLKKGKAESRHLQNSEEFIGILLDLIEGKEVQKENVISVSLIERDSTR